MDNHFIIFQHWNDNLKIEVNAKSEIKCKNYGYETWFEINIRQVYELCLDVQNGECLYTGKIRIRNSTNGFNDKIF